MRCACVVRLELGIQLHTNTILLSSLLLSSSTDVWNQARPLAPLQVAPVLLGLTLPGVINILTHVESAALGRTPVGKVRLSARVIRGVLFAVANWRLNIQ